MTDSRHILRRVLYLLVLSTMQALVLAHQGLDQDEQKKINDFMLSDEEKQQLRAQQVFHSILMEE